LADNAATSIRLAPSNEGRQPAPTEPQQLEEALNLPERQPAIDAHGYQRFLVIADCENALTPVRETLRYTGLLKKRGDLRSKYAQGLHVVQTGDLLHKHQPDPEVVRFWLSLRRDIEEQGGRLTMLAGNHELEAWKNLCLGERLGLKRKQCQLMSELMSVCKLFYVAGSVLFLHGYPTLNLLSSLRGFQDRTGLSLNDYNEHCFRKALNDPEKLQHYLYLRSKNARKLLLHDLDDALGYYRANGKEIAELLRHFGIEQVVHGHRPIRSGVQTDREFRRWLPGVRMIGNDTQIRLRGLGAVVMRTAPEEQAEILFVNHRNCRPDQRKQVRRALRADTPPPTALGLMAGRRHSQWSRSETSIRPTPPGRAN
jgi:hypothetical protein